MARTTISIPDDLKRRMDRMKEPVNWSAVAAEAFELKLGEIARQKKEKTMESVIARLRASKIQHTSGVVKEGQDLGAKWAREVAEYAELERLAGLDLDNWFAGRPNAPYGWGAYLAFAINGTPDYEYSHEESERFWDVVVGDPRDKRLGDAEFLQAFVEGAVSVYEQVSDQI